MKQPETGSDKVDIGADYPFLDNLCTCYFDQDYDTISEDVDEILEYYKAEAQPGNPEDLAQEARRFLATYDTGDDEQLTKAFRRMFHPAIAFYNWKYRTTREGLLKIIEIMTDDSKPGAAQP